MESFEYSCIQNFVDVLLLLILGSLGGVTLIVYLLLNFEDAVAADKVVAELVVIEKLKTICDVL